MSVVMLEPLAPMMTCTPSLMSFSTFTFATLDSVPSSLST
jgi:hypothetical protein